MKGNIYNLTKYEMETIVNFNEEESIASIYTCSKALIKKLDTYCKKRPDIYKLDEVDSPSKTYTFPKKYISLRLPKVLTQKQKEHLSEIGFGKKVKIK